MKRIIYFCPKVSLPYGGIKVIHRHSQIINEIGGQSCVYYHAGENTGKIDWFHHNAEIKRDSVFDPSNDFVILPECWIMDSWKLLKNGNTEYGIFIQAPYQVRHGINENEIEECYENAKFLICISEDVVNCVFQFFPAHVHKIIRVSTSVNTSLFRIGSKENIITYMPRKMAHHSELLIPVLRSKLPETWRIVAIDNMSEVGVAEVLTSSQIFLAFVDLEGLGLPPIEAALSGNFVIGYTGQGGKEYWNRPIFNEIQTGDISGFLDATLNKVQEIEKYDLKIGENHLSFLKKLYSLEMEENLLKMMIQRIHGKPERKILLR